MKARHHLSIHVLCCLSLVTTAQAVNYYWDGNDSVSGYGTATGTWADPTAGTTTSGWSTSTNGTAAVDGNSVTTLVGADSAFFGNGATGLGSGTITVSGTVGIAGMRFASGSGDITLSGGSIDISKTSNAEVTFTVDSSLATIASSLVGSSNANSFGITKAGSGMLVLSGDNSGYTGPSAGYVRTTISGGVLKFDGANSMLNGLITYKSSGGVLGLTSSTGDFSRKISYSPGSNDSIQFSADGGFAAYGGDRLVAITNSSGGTAQFGSAGNSQITGALILGHATADSKVTVTSNLDINGRAAVIQSGNGSAVIDGAISGVISDSVGTGSLTKTGAGALALGGVNTFTGNTTVSDGTLILQDNAQLRFAIGANGINNSILGTGILQLDGDLMFNLSLATTNPFDAWSIVDVANLSETYGSTFSVLSTNGSFSESSGIWTIAENGTTYQFSESTGVLMVIPEPSAMLLGGVGLLCMLRRRRD